MRRRSLTAGFTLVELLAVIAIIGILVALLLPAVQQAREAARRVSCLNNLKQLSLAVINYESAKKQLPPSGIAGETLDEYDGLKGKLFSWVVEILPFIEEQNLAATFDTSRHILDQKADPQAMQLAVLLCPSDDSRGSFYVHPALRNKRFAKGNYAAFVSPYHVEMQKYYPGALTAGKVWKYKNIPDGPSHTLMLSEVRVRQHPEDQRGVWALPWNGSSLLAFDMHPAGDLISLEANKFEGGPESLGQTQPPNNTGANVDMLYDCPDLVAAQLEGMPCGVFNPSRNAESHYLSAAPRSRHPGGVHVAFMDGRIGFLVDGVEEFTMAYLISSNDRRPVDIDTYVR
jgi:prepilin-type N-terminal cleavage/methylation domain-containing protein/prepilin-type processing-associated H-X9-DG protein